jgi:L-arabinokinase
MLPRNIALLTECSKLESALTINIPLLRSEAPTEMSSFKINRALSSDTQHFVNALDETNDPRGAGFLSRGKPILVTRAPGRLDVMGGIADYSGSLVLQLPIRNATHVALQKSDHPKARLLSLGSRSEKRFVEIDLTEFQNGKNEPIAYTDARKRFSDSFDHWVSYAVGAFLVLMREKGCEFSTGAAILIQSNVPEGKGVSSSAALEVAVMQAINVAYGIGLNAQEIARLCQKVENLIAGAPCGIMDQMTSACGQENQLLELLCQPDILNGSLRLPSGLELWGIDSGVRHSVGGSDYGTVRTAAFMGYRMIADSAGLEVSSTNTTGKVNIEDPRWHGYLANLTPSEFENYFASKLPERITGEEFLKSYKGITDHVTHVNPADVYPVASATRHPVYEKARVTSFAETLKNWPGMSAAPALGNLMFESHQSYSVCGLGSEATDLLVSLVRESADQGLYGARITGGGSGGTVAVLGRAGAKSAIEDITRQFNERTGYQPIVFSGSSPGAGAFDHIKLEPNGSEL